MYARQQLPESLLRLGIHQAGVVTTAQAESAGMSRAVIARCLHDGNLTAITRGVYRLGTAPVDWHALTWAGHLVGGEGSRIAGEAAAHLHGLLEEAPGVVDVLVPEGRRIVRVDPRWRFVHEQSDARGRDGRGSPPRLSVEDTVLDLCLGASERDVVGWVTSAVELRLTTPDRLQRRADARKRLSHRRLIADLLVDVDLGAESPLEVKFLRDVERAHGLPDGRRQRGRLAYVTDVLYELFGLLVELDGRKGHEGMGRFRDMYRDNELLVDGLSTARYGWMDVVDRPCEVAWQIARVLMARGWTGLPTRCRRCTRVPR